MNKFKKIIGTVALFFAGISSLSAFDSHGRLVELKFDLPFTVANNTVGILDYLVPEVEVDLSDFVKQMPSNGFVFSTDFNPSISANVYLFDKFMVGLNTGINMYSRFGLSKDVFDFIANGNDENDDLNVTEKIDGYSDMFAYLKADLGFTLDSGKYEVLVSPTFFTTVYHAVMEDSYVNAFNRLDSSFGFNVNGNIDFYSVLPISEELLSPEYWSDYSKYLSNLWMAFGMDVAGQVSTSLLDNLKITGSFRVPLVPSHLNGKTGIRYNASMDTNITEIASGTANEITQDVSFGETYEGDYIVNRPLKVFVQGDYSLLNEMIVCTAGIGLGYEHPFASNGEESSAYVDYLLQGKLNLMDMFNVTLSTECMDMIYRHSLSAGANLKFFELNVGGSLSSSTFSSSFRGTGLSLFTTLTIGL